MSWKNNPSVLNCSYRNATFFLLPLMEVKTRRLILPKKNAWKLSRCIHIVKFWKYHELNRLTNKETGERMKIECPALLNSNKLRVTVGGKNARKRLRGSPTEFMATRFRPLVRMHLMRIIWAAALGIILVK